MTSQQREQAAAALAVLITAWQRHPAPNAESPSRTTGRLLPLPGADYGRLLPLPGADYGRLLPLPGAASDTDHAA
jgi:hypothetical protein